MDDIKRIKVFLASPSDVSDERSLAHKVLSHLPYDPFLRDKLSIEVVAWDVIGSPPMEANLSPQEAIRKGLPLPSECDIFVAILWSRIGTPVFIGGVQYLSGTHFEYCDAREKNKKNGYPKLLVYKRSEKINLDPDSHTFEDELKQYQQLKVFFNEFNDSQTGMITGGYNSYQNSTDFEKLIESHIKNIIKEILEEKKETPVTMEKLRGIEDEKYSVKYLGVWNKSPFPGLRAFTSEDEAIFFGRSREVNSLVRRVRSDKFVAIVGSSGSGKSSLIGAGLIPRLFKTSLEGYWIPISFTPDNLGIGNPFKALAAALVKDLKRVNIKSLINDIGSKPIVLSSLCDIIGETQVNKDFKLLIIIDQFEELFTTIDKRLINPFIEMLFKSTDDDRIRIVITLRGDFYNHCVEKPKLVFLMEKGTFPLSTPEVGDLFDMITRPAYRANLEIEEGLAQRIINDTGIEPGALALMAYTLDELYTICKDDGILTHKNYELIGGVKGAIGTRAELVYNSLKKSSQEALKNVFRELIEVDERGTSTRRRESLSKIAVDEPSSDLLNELTKARLLVQNRGINNRPIVEVAHEALLRSWTRLANWIEETQDDLRLLRQVKIAAKEWELNSKSVSFLWPHERLEPVYKMQENLQVIFDPTVAEFVRPEIDRLLDEWNSSSIRGHKRLALIDRFSQIGDTAVPILIEALSPKSSEIVRTNAARALGNMKEVSAVPYLIDLIKDDRPGIASIIALGKIGKKEAVNPLINKLVDLSGGFLPTYPDTLRLKACQSIATALGKIKDPQAVDTLIRVNKIAYIPSSVLTASITALKKIATKDATEYLNRLK